MRSISYAGRVEAKPAISSVLSIKKYYIGSVEADVTAEANRIVGRVRTGLAESIVITESSYAYVPSGATAYPYAGTIEASISESSDRNRSKVYAGSPEAKVISASDRNRAKAYAGAVLTTVVSDSVRYKSKVYIGSVSVTVEIGGVYFSTAAIAKVYAGSAETIIVAECVHSAAISTAYTYVGVAYVVAESSKINARGRAYASDAGLVVVVDSRDIYSFPVAHPYEGSVLISVDTTGVGAFNLWDGRDTEAKPHDGYYQEVLPVTALSLENKPNLRDTQFTDDGGYNWVDDDPNYWSGYAGVKEPLPTRPVGVDGAYTEPLEDGAWDEYPVDGAYTQIGYEKEFKPFRRSSMTKEGKPL
jgi:hypothetical protein